MRQWRNVQFNRPITMCIAQFNLYLVVLVVAILPITRPAIASHNLARFNPGINPVIPGLSKLNPEIPGLAKRSGIAFPSCIYLSICCLQSKRVSVCDPPWTSGSYFSNLRKSLLFFQSYFLHIIHVMHHRFVCLYFVLLFSPWLHLHWCAFYTSNKYYLLKGKGKG